MFNNSSSQLDSIQQLETILNFYKTEQLWILHAKAAQVLKDVSQEIIPVTKQEIEEVDLNSLTSSSSESSSDPPEPSPNPSINTTTPNGNKPLWQRRRHTTKLKLANLSTQRPSRRIRSGETLLHLYGSLIDSRIESCQRMAHMIMRDPSDHHRPSPFISR